MLSNNSCELRTVQLVLQCILVPRIMLISDQFNAYQMRLRTHYLTICVQNM